MTTTPTPDEAREGRKALGFSQQQMAALLRYGAKSRIYELESGRKAMSGPSSLAFDLMTGRTTVDQEIAKIRDQKK